MVYFGFLNGLFLFRYMLAGQRRLRNQIYWPVLLSLFVFSAFRWQVGCDWFGYWNQFWIADMHSIASILEVREGLWWWILTQLKSQGFAHPWANVVSSAIFFAGVHVLGRRQPDPLAFLILLFPVLIINITMSGIRQAAAIGVVCVAFSAFIDRKPLRFAAFVGLASLLHTSALLFLLLTPLVSGQYTRTRLVLAGMIAVPGIVVLMGSLGAQVAIVRYIDTGIEAAGAIFRVGLLTMSGAYFLLFLRQGWQRTFPEDYALVHLGSLMMIALLGVVAVSTVIGDRIGYYLIPIQAIIFARLPWMRFRSMKSVLVAMPYVGLVVFFGIWMLISRHFQLCYLPYGTWITGMPPEAYLPPGSF